MRELNITAATEAVGPVLRGARLGVGLTLVELAARLRDDSVSKSTLSRIERGEQRPSPGLLSRIAQVIADEVNAQSGRAS